MMAWISLHEMILYDTLLFDLGQSFMLRVARVLQTNTYLCDSSCSLSRVNCSPLTCKGNRR